MTTEIYIISGFLGAGKTTFIQRMLKETFKGRNVALIENDFGELSIDATLLNQGGVEVKALNSGCICCSLTGDFIAALKELSQRFNPEIIIIEPSGVGKLSDVTRACDEAAVQIQAKLKSKVTIVDVKRCRTYLENFGEFFEDQIKHADTVVLSRTEDHPQKVDDASTLVKQLNAQVRLFAMPLSELTIEAVIADSNSVPNPKPKRFQQALKRGTLDTFDLKSPARRGEGIRVKPVYKSHNAEAIFETLTLHLDQIFSEETVKKCFEEMTMLSGSKILRAKGILKGSNRSINVQYLPGELHISESASSGQALCIIGQKLEAEVLKHIWGGN